MKTQVAIIGGGPVGLGLAIELGQRGVDCTVVERRTTPQPIPKGQNLTQRTMEHFRAWGAEPALRAARTIPPSFGIGGLTAYGTLLGEYHYDWLQREIVRPYYFTDNERLPQYETEAVLRRRVAEIAAIQTHFGWQCEGFEARDDGVSVQITGASSLTLEADYLVGCDGSRSMVREQASIGQTLSDHDRLMVLLVFRSQQLNRLLERHPGKSFFCVLHPELQGYWRFFGRVDLAGTWFFHAPVPRGTTEHNTDFRRLLHEAAGAEFDVAFDHVGFWDLRFAVAENYLKGRVLIAGDAAHSHPPYGGYGVNTGFEDARNLGWKLAAVLQGWGGPGLLASYDAERRPVFVSTARDFIEKSIVTDRDFLAQFDPSRDRGAFERAWAERASGARGEVGSFEPNYEGPASALGRHEFRARSGHHLAPLPLGDGRNAFETLGSGFTLLAQDGNDADVNALVQAAANRGIPLTLVRGGHERYEAGLILVRPDEFVAWCSQGGPFDADLVLARASGAA